MIYRAGTGVRTHYLLLSGLVCQVIMTWVSFGVGLFLFFVLFFTLRLEEMTNPLHALLYWTRLSNQNECYCYCQTRMTYSESSFFVYRNNRYFSRKPVVSFDLHVYRALLDVSTKWRTQFCVVESDKNVIRSSLYLTSKQIIVC